MGHNTVSDDLHLIDLAAFIACWQLFCLMAFSRGFCQFISVRSMVSSMHDLSMHDLSPIALGSSCKLHVALLFTHARFTTIVFVIFGPSLKSLCNFWKPAPGSFLWISHTMSIVRYGNISTKASTSSIIKGGICCWESDGLFPNQQTVHETLCMVETHQKSMLNPSKAIDH